MNNIKASLRGLLVLGIMLSVVLLAFAQSQEDVGRVWNAFTAWIRTNPGNTSLKAYAEKLEKDGVAADEIQRRLDIIRQLFKEQPLRSVEISYDHIFSKPLTGDPKKDGFTSTPSVFMVEASEKLSPGRALDVGAGQGRNAVWLAQQGWDVTAIDISGGGLAAAAANAEKAGVTISTVKTSYQDFDFGTEQWDLIVMILSWAPISEPEFAARLKTALRPGGVIVFEHVLQTDKQKFPVLVRALPPNALLEHFAGFFIQYYEEGVWPGDWGGPPAELVRAIVKKMPEDRS